MVIIRRARNRQLPFKDRFDYSKEPRKILVRIPNWIGDGILSIPATEAIKKNYCNAELTVIAKSWVAPVFFNNPWVDRVIEYDIAGRHRSIVGKWRLIGDLKREDFDLVVLFQNAFEAALLTFLAGIPSRIGYNRDFRGPLLSHPVAVDPGIGKRHQVYYYLDLLKVFDNEVTAKPAPKLYLKAQEEDWAGRFIVGEGVEDVLIIGMAPGASYGPAKRWGSEKFAEVAQRLIAEYRAKVIVFGDKGDYSICREIVERTGGRALNLAGRTTLRQFISLANRCSLFITNDSGPMHIASALGVPTVAIFGSTDSTLTGPLNENSIVVKKDTECSPCFKRTCSEGDYRCLKGITVEDILRPSFEIIEGMGKDVKRSCLS